MKGTLDWGAAAWAAVPEYPLDRPHSKTHGRSVSCGSKNMEQDMKQLKREGSHTRSNVS